MNNQECEIRSEIINVNNNEPVFYPFSIKVNKCSGSCNNISDPMITVFNLMSFSNQTRHIESHETCKCKCRLDASVLTINKDGMKINVGVNVEKN